MAVVVINNDNSTQNGGSSLTFAHNITSGRNKTLIVFVSISDPGSDTVQSVTYNGVNLTKIAQVANGTDIRTEAWQLNKPALGNNNVVVTLTGGTHEFGASAISVSGSNGVLDGTNTDTGTGAPNNSVVSKVNSLVLDFVGLKGAQPDTLTVGGGQTELAQFTGTNNRYGYSREGGAASVNMSWSQSGTRAFAHVSVSVGAGTQGDVEFDAVSTKITVSNRLTEAFDHTCSGNDRMLIVVVAARSNDPTAVTYGGIAMTSAGAKASAPIACFMFYLANPPSGTNSVSITFNGSGQDAIMGAASFTSSNGQVSGYATAVGNTNVEGQPTVTITATEDGMVIDILGGGFSTFSPTHTAGAGQTENFDLEADGGNDGDNYGASSRQDGETSVVMSWSGLAAGDDWGIAALNVKGGFQFTPRVMQY